MMMMMLVWGPHCENHQPVLMVQQREGEIQNHSLEFKFQFHWLLAL